MTPLQLEPSAGTMHQDNVRLITHSAIPPMLKRTRSSRPSTTQIAGSGRRRALRAADMARCLVTAKCVKDRFTTYPIRNARVRPHCPHEVQRLGAQLRAWILHRLSLRWVFGSTLSAVYTIRRLGICDDTATSRHSTIRRTHWAATREGNDHE